ncbi:MULTISPECIES: class I SAM-dependent methyltransferase [Rheinheimera]|jgi:predicted methyltransferase|uniref:Class I SAM-dependent methyltransferase n=1 Tax=Rheinheimera aquimaris TaxID=412437 RepID=A0ABN1DY15_9GAMM|nr:MULTISPECIES: methyltransferase [Rheinheimera]MCB5213720.1 methyltransferase [Rheinheimera aquimaris]|tara:strand:+ start:10143 stop:10991 length:849 start_codon:yes stop_codon:yes gene_type:complete
MSIITTRKTVVLSLLFSCIAFSSVADTAAQSTEFQQLAESAQRSAEHIQRNEYRHPAQTLQFFGIKPDMSVLEIWPGHGWYTEILAPFLKEQGKLTLAQFRHNDGSLKDDRSIFWARVSERLAQRIADNAEYFGTPDMIELDPPLFYPQQNEQYDMVLTFRNAHIWNEDGNLFATLQSIFAALKPGGILGMVEHRAARLSDISSSAVEGYLDESYVIEAAELAGFTLMESSELNANPADTKNYPKGVYALPPTLAMGNYNKAEYLKIGESDRMTLKFIKPEQ